MKLRITTETPWEREFGYARAIRSGDFIAVSGTVAAGADGRPECAGAYAQTVAVLRRIDDALRRAGGDLSDVVRLRLYYARTEIGNDFARGLREAFPKGAPALTAVCVASLVSEEFLVEIEADAIVTNGRLRRDPSEAGEEAD